jgi:S1-C subfamily serine protease
MKHSTHSIRNSAIIMMIMMGLFLVSTMSASAKPEKTGYIGVRIEDASSTIEKQLGISGGVVIRGVEKDSPAEKAGLSSDDIIVKVNDQEITKASTLSRTIHRMEPGAKAKVEFYHNGKKSNAEITIGEGKSCEVQCGNMGEQKHMIQIIKGGAYLGVKIQDLNSDLAPYFHVKPEEGVLVIEVTKDSPAEKAGLKAGDVINKIDSEAVTSTNEVLELLADYEENDVVAIDYVRQQNAASAKATLTERDCKQQFFFGEDFPEKMMHQQFNNDEQQQMMVIPDGPNKQRIEIHKKIQGRDDSI